MLALVLSLILGGCSNGHCFNKHHDHRPVKTFFQKKPIRNFIFRNK